MSKKLTKFKYEQLDELTADFLRQKESNMRQIVGKAYTELGKELYEAQQELAGNNHHDGVFEQWYTYLGWKKRTVYNLIDRYLLVQKLHDKEKETLEDLPVTLTYEIARPNSEDTSEKAQAKTEVLSGDIATLKEYRERIKELERKAEQAERQTEIERKERERLERENEELANREPETIIKTEYIEKEPGEPYDRTYDSPYAVERGSEFYRMMRDVDELYKKYAHLRDGVEELRGIAEYDADLQIKYRKADEFWRMLGEIFKEDNDDIIDVEII